MKREEIVAVCATTGLVVTPFAINALARKFSETPCEERQVRAVLYLCVDVVLVVILLSFWMWG